MKIFEIEEILRNCDFTKVDFNSKFNNCYYNQNKKRLVVLLDFQILNANFFREDINKIAESVRELVKKDENLSVNIWNTYLIILLNKNEFSEKYYYLERDTRNLRKYVLQIDEDINRIPFLSKSNKLFNNSQESLVLNSELDKLRKILVDNNAENVKISRKKMSDILEEINFFEE